MLVQTAIYLIAKKFSFTIIIFVEYGVELNLIGMYLFLPYILLKIKK